VSEKQNIWMRAIAALFLHSRIALIGASIATAAFVGGVALMIMGRLFGVTSPYIGIMAFFVFPAIFVLGLVLIPIGNAWTTIRRRKQEHKPAGYPKLDFSVPRVRREFGIVLFLTAVNLFIVSTATFQGVAYMETNQFCGQVCHTVMEPEFTAHQHGPHANVHCVDCHIGPGADSFVKAKLNGVNQMIGVLTNSYEKPIPTPVHNFPGGEQICTKCHDPMQYIGDKVRVFTEYGDDELSTPMHSVLVMNVGGEGAESGIHTWHNDPSKRILFYAADDERQDIQYVRVEHDDGTIVEYVEDGVELPAEAKTPDALREMDCIDCHNRPAHTFELPQVAMDTAMTRGFIDKTIPFIKSAGHEALHATALDGGTADDAAAALLAFYAAEHAEFKAANEAKLAQAAQQVREIYARNIFPKMDMTWGTYPDNSSHIHFEGCFRCHDDGHTNADGETISQDCTMCHDVLAFQEESPEILTQLNLP
jgi:nitrate/TMAO reductase-like tetraheme cytochrome c subunit